MSKEKGEDSKPKVNKKAPKLKDDPETALDLIKDLSKNTKIPVDCLTEQLLMWALERVYQLDTIQIDIRTGQLILEPHMSVKAQPPQFTEEEPAYDDGGKYPPANPVPNTGFNSNPVRPPSIHEGPVSPEDHPSRHVAGGRFAGEGQTRRIDMRGR